MNQGKNPLRQKLRNTLGELQTLRDEIRVRLHLMGMDAKDAMADLEPRIDRLEKEVEHAGDDALDKLSDALDKIAKSLHALRDRHEHASRV